MATGEGEKAAPGLSRRKVSPQHKNLDAERLELFMENGNKAVAFIRNLPKSVGDGVEILMGILADERSHLKKLQLEYFLLTGDSYAPPRPAQWANT